MGHRAHFFILENQRAEVYYSHWGATRLPCDLFWGPDHAIRFVRTQKKVEDFQILDAVLAEGAAGIDHDKQRLLLFGGIDLLYDVPLRRIYLDLIRRVWSPWEVRWAQDGIVEIVEYAGYPEAQSLLTGCTCCILTSSLAPPPRLDWTDLIASVRARDGRLRFHPLTGDVARFLLTGTAFAKSCEAPESDGFSSWLDWESDGFPVGGIHIDLAARTLEYWTSHDLPGLPGRVSVLWSDWNVTWHRDRFESQLERTGGKLTIPVRPIEALRAELVRLLLGGSGDRPLEMLKDVSNVAASESRRVSVSVSALRDDRLELDLAERRRILAFAMGGPQADNDAT